ncbi:MAG: hypothetical protein WBD07_15905 [Vicinamibacterales bacterium]
MAHSFIGRPMAALLVFALVGMAWEGTARAGGPDDRGAGFSTAVARASERPIAASVARIASTESYRLQQPAQGSAGASGGASLAEKMAFVYLLVGGSMFLAISPGEKVDGEWTNDALSETIFGAGAIGISFWLLHDILKKRPVPPSS